MTEQGAAADNADRDGASGGAGPFTRGSCVSQDAQAGRSQGRPKGADRKAPGRLPALHSPRLRGNGKRDEGPAPGPEIKTTGQRSVGYCDCVTSGATSICEP